jgi:hypothetical protein
MVIQFWGFSLKNEAKMKRKMIAEKRECKYMKGWSLGPTFNLNGFTHELIGPQTNNILLIIWGQTMSQEVFKFSIIGPKILFFGPDS